MTFVIGCDLGTTATKTGLFDEKGNCLVVARKNSHIIYGKDGSVIQDPTEMLGTVVETIREVMEKSGVKPAEVLGIALDGQMAGVMGVDEKGEAATPYDSWLDIRSSGYADVMKQKAEDLIIRRSGMAPSINHGPKILWWKNEQPDVYRTIRAFTMPSCWIEQKLSGLSGEETYIDPTYLHFSCFADLVNNRWDPEIIGLFEIEEHKFPRIVEPWDTIGGVQKEWADQMGLLAGTPLVAGCGDQAANCLGAGVSEPGIAFDVAGTASCFCLFVDSYRADVKYKTILFPRAVLRDRYYPMAYINGGGMDLEWAKNELFRDVVSSPEAFSRMAEEIEKNAPSPSGVVFVPHLRGRNCPTQSHLRGVFAGFSWDHTRAQLYRAILEGIAFEYAYYVQVIRELIPEVKFKEVRVIGGGAKSPLWNRIKASVLQVPYVELNRQEFAIWGAAMVAGFAAGLYDDLPKVSMRSVERTRIHQPDEKLASHYQKMIPYYLETMAKMNGVFESYPDLL